MIELTGSSRQVRKIDAYIDLIDCLLQVGDGQPFVVAGRFARCGVAGHFINDRVGDACALHERGCTMTEGVEIQPWGIERRITPIAREPFRIIVAQPVIRAARL